MKKEGFGIIIAIILFSIIYVVNFVQLIVALSNEQWNIAVIKLIGVLTAFGSVVTVWF